MNACETNRITEATDATDEAKAKSGRDANGRFTKGNGGGPGNPFARRVAALRVAFLSAVTEADLQAIARELVVKARTGNLQAAKLVLQYIIGKPTGAPNPDHVELDEWDYFKKTAAMSDDVDKVMKSLEPDVVLDMGREMRPIVSAIQTDRLSTALETGDESILDANPCEEPPAAEEVKVETEEAPSANGDNGEQAEPAPSTNGGNGEEADESLSSIDGLSDEAILAKLFPGLFPPSTSGDNGEPDVEPPSTNGV